MDTLGLHFQRGEPIKQKLGLFEHTCHKTLGGELEISDEKNKVDVDIVEVTTLLEAVEQVKQFNLKAKLSKKHYLKPGEESTIQLKYLI